MELATPPKKPTLIDTLSSPVLKKVSTGITGILLILYLGQHLLANLRIFSSDPTAVSQYGHTLLQFGFLLRLIEIGLAVVIIYHAVLGVAIWLNKRKARPTEYERSLKGQFGSQSWASRTMIWGGLLILVFLVIHVAWFRFGPGIAEGYTVQIDGEDARHYERLMSERFEQLGFVIFYCISMLAVGIHLSHGFWSAFQSLGLITDKNRKTFQRVGFAIAAVITLGFISIPLYLYFG